MERFFGVLKRFNKNLPINRRLMEEIYTFIEMNEKHDKTMAMKKEKDIDLLHQLPYFVQNRIYKEFLFEDFLVLFRKAFTYAKQVSPIGTR